MSLIVTTSAHLNSAFPCFSHLWEEIDGEILVIFLQWIGSEKQRFEVGKVFEEFELRDGVVAEIELL